jgi:patatin-like phospholipase/acyl hydrolase
MVLAYMEDRTGKRISQLFDVVAGTSTGGILALGLACPNADGTGPKYKARELVDLYAKEGLNIFPPGWISGVLQVIEPKYSARGLEFVLQRYFGDTTLREAVVDVLVPAYDIEHRNVMFFRSGMAKTQNDYNYPMRVVARATSAGPTYFPPLSLDGVAGSQSHFTLIDGGVVLNDPAMAAYMDDWAGQAAHPTT